VNLVSTDAAINGANRQRYMLNDGRVLFDTAGPLVPLDVNHRTDVYEYEPGGVGSCTSSTSSSDSMFVPEELGCISLISDGASEVSDAILADASTNGSDVFFTTSQSLVPQLDQDEITYLYDARENGGFPPPPPSPCPTETACPAASATPPLVPSTPSLTDTSLEPAGISPVAEPTKKSTTNTVVPSRAARLSKALALCKKDRSKKTRSSCQKKAHKAYGSTK